MHPRAASLLLSVTVGTAGCAGPGLDLDSEDVAAVESELNNGITAASYDYKSAVYFPERHCTGTLIAPRWVLTAIWCQGASTDHVRFYLGSPVASTSNTRTITYETLLTDTHMGPYNWPDTSSWDYIDGNGDFAELLLVRLSADAPTGAVPAVMAWRYPGDNEGGRKVGAGEHDGSENRSGFLRTKTDTTRSGNDDDGAFLTNHRDLNEGDEGGGFMYGSSLLGVLSKGVYDWGERAKYVSVPFRLNWILGRIGWVWPGAAPISSHRFLGYRLSTVATTIHRTCQYVCATSSQCVGYSFQTSNTTQPFCELFSEITLGGAQSGYTSARR